MHPARPLILLSLLVASLGLPVANLPYVSVGGTTEGLLDRFLGIPYTNGPVLRFTEGVLPNSPKGFFNATKYGPSCPQLTRTSSVKADEQRCLNLDISRISGTQETANLPVMVWIYGGSFTDGETSIYNPALFLPYGRALGMPFIFVAVNYRLGGFGFLNSRELAARTALNLGLKDQRLALRWIKQYIAPFGGDPNKITVFGESAGAISIGLHLSAYGNVKDTGLFRAAILESGAGTSVAIPAPTHYQSAYDFMVNKTGCHRARDTFKCLQSADATVFARAAQGAKVFWNKGDTGPFGLSLDRDFILDQPSRLFKSGAFARVPILAGDNRDEGTLFVNRSAAAFENDTAVSNAVLFQAPQLTPEQLQKWLSLYPNNASLGSPYGTGNRTYFSPQYKRAASIEGDFIFVAARRYLTDVAANFSVPTWAYRFDYVADPALINTTSYLGVAHASELTSVFRAVNSQTSADMAAYWIAFATHLNPNQGLQGKVQWDQFTAQDKKQIRFETDATRMDVDNYRREGTDLINSLLAQLQR